MMQFQKLPGLRLHLATSQLIRQWAQHQLPNGKKINGQILNPKTVNYQTLKPEKDGLFCERIFGPVEDFKCACGRPPQRGRKFCPRCEVEYISSRVRRYRLGYIQLTTAAAHIWFFKGRPNYFALFLNLSKTKIESLLYCTHNISRTIFPKEILNFTTHSILPTSQNSLNWRSFPKTVIFLSREAPFWNFQKPLKIVFSKSLDSRHSRRNFLKKTFRRKSSFFRKSLWKKGGLKDSALYFGFALISKMFSWRIPAHWFCFVYFLISPPQKSDVLNVYYPGPPGLLNFWGFHSRLFCLTGVQLMRTWLTQLTQYQCNDGRLLEIQIRLDLFQLERCWSPMTILSETEFLQKIQFYRRLKYLRCFRHTQLNPASMVLNVLPVLPPDLRPILQLKNNQIAISDFNKLYQTLLFRNKRLYRLSSDKSFHCLNSEALQYAQRLLQESVDSLIENGKVGRTKQPTKSLSDLFKGKKGRFRQNLLGKRVDYSGRSVIVVGPYLKIYECGLPKEMAYELFQPFLLRTLMWKKKAQTILGAKKLFKQKPKFIWNLLKQIVHSHPIFLNRAPTLHRLSVQAFRPRLVEGKALLLHPLVCSAFNADFDGDQMGVHIPLCFEARAEAWKILWSQNNLFSIANSTPTCSPSQDMILGSCFLTTRNLRYQNVPEKNLLFKKPLFKKNSLFCSPRTPQKKGEISDFLLIENAFIRFKQQSRAIPQKSSPTLQSANQISIWWQYNPYFSGYETEQLQQKLIEIRLNSNGHFQKLRPEVFQNFHVRLQSGVEVFRKVRTTFGRLKFFENVLFF
uniref:DNA-directed RNA polymerase subunit n=1 Tax=Pseudocodium devriesii TaxID=453070 RepID=A0A386B0X2_9CHLO|nr:RNA polymerase b-subunit [Pseudocodium devriesii]AYC65348.1 RNA polymerase b-subunit [Pseudocodium devriesii]